MRLRTNIPSQVFPSKLFLHTSIRSFLQSSSLSIQRRLKTVSLNLGDEIMYKHPSKPFLPSSSSTLHSRHAPLVLLSIFESLHTATSNNWHEALVRRLYTSILLNLSGQACSGHTPMILLTIFESLLCTDNVAMLLKFRTDVLCSSYNLRVSPYRVAWRWC